MERGKGGEREILTHGAIADGYIDLAACTQWIHKLLPIEGHLLRHPRGGVGQRLLRAVAQLAFPLCILGTPVGAFDATAHEFATCATCDVAAGGGRKYEVV